MNMSFREKSIWISLISTLIVFGDYFFNVISFVGMPEELAKTITLELSIRALFLIILIEIIFQGLLAASNHKAAKFGADERDKLFEYKGNNIGYAVLAIGVFLTLASIVVLEINPSFIEQFKVMKTPLFTAHILLFSFIFSELIRFSSQLYYYRSSY